MSANVWPAAAASGGLRARERARRPGDKGGYLTVRTCQRPYGLMRGVVGMPRRSRSVRDSDGRSGSLPPAFELGGQEEDLMSAGERVTWETCPRCGLSAVVGWRDG